MEITATELKLNLGKYLEAANDEVIVITKNGKTIANLIGTRSYKYDFSELEEFEASIKNGLVLGEAPAPGYSAQLGAQPGAQPGPQLGAQSGGETAACAEAKAAAGAQTDIWLLTHNGEPVAQLKPVLKEKPKRRLGFMQGPPASPETIAALFEPIMTDEEYERWLNKKL